MRKIMKETIISNGNVWKKMEKERHAREKKIKDITKRKTVQIVVTNHVECYKQKLTLPHKRKQHR